MSPAPGRVRVLVAATGLGGLACALAALRDVAAAGGPVRPLAVVAVAAVLLVGDISLLQMRHGRNSISYTWGEAALLTGAALAGWDWVVLLVGPVLLVRQLAAHRPWTKVVFNAGNAVLAAALARAVDELASPGTAYRLGPVGWHAVLGLVLAASVYFLLVSVTTACAVGWSQGVPVREVWLRGLRLRLVMFAGNTGTGVAVVAVGAHNRPVLVALPFVVLVVYLAYNDYVRAQQERDSWRELHHTASRLGQVDPGAVVSAVQRGARTLFGAEVAGLMLYDADGFATLPAPALLGLAGRGAGPVSLQASQQPPPVAAEMAALGLTSAVLAPLYTGGVVTGCLLVGYGATVRLTRRELGMLATFADQTSLSVQHTRYFAEVDGQRRRLAGIVDSTTDGILLLDATGVVRAWNPAMGRVAGVDAGHAVGQPLEQVLVGQLEDGAAVTGAELIRRGDRPGGLVLGAHLTDSDGGHREVSMSVSVVRSGDEPSVVVVARDVTAQRDLEHAKEDFLATVSHELRTPLTPIKGYLAMLQRPGLWTDTDRREEVLAILRDQAGQLEQTVEDLLSVSAMTRGPLQVHRSAVDVDGVVERAVDESPAAARRPVRHVRAAAPALCSADPLRLRQVVGTLLSNADKYSPAGAPVEVRVTAGPDVHITVSDAGPGVPREAREAVFEPFRRLGNHLTRSTRGAGLGLHIARQLVEAMDGRIWVDARPSQTGPSQTGPGQTGAVFHVRLPALPPSTDPTAGPAAGTAAGALPAPSPPRDAERAGAAPHG